VNGAASLIVVTFVDPNAPRWFVLGIGIPFSVTLFFQLGDSDGLFVDSSKNTDLTNRPWIKSEPSWRPSIGSATFGELAFRGQRISVVCGPVVSNALANSNKSVFAVADTEQAR
jgi:hypothetical protein